MLLLGPFCKLQLLRRYCFVFLFARQSFPTRQEDEDVKSALVTKNLMFLAGLFCILKAWAYQSKTVLSFTKVN
jgi:hypothetical protein